MSENLNGHQQQNSQQRVSLFDVTTIFRWELKFCNEDQARLGLSGLIGCWFEWSTYLHISMVIGKPQN